MGINDCSIQNIDIDCRSVSSLFDINLFYALISYLFLLRSSESLNKEQHHDVFSNAGFKVWPIFVTLIVSEQMLSSTRESSPNNSVNDILPFIVIPTKLSLLLQTLYMPSVLL